MGRQGKALGGRAQAEMLSSLTKRGYFFLRLPVLTQACFPQFWEHPAHPFPWGHISLDLPLKGHRPANAGGPSGFISTSSFFEKLPLESMS